MGDPAKKYQGDGDNKDELQYRFYSLCDFLKITKKEGNYFLLWNRSGILFKNLNKILQLINDPEIGVAQQISPVVVRNKFFSIGIAPVEEVEECAVSYQGPTHKRERDKAFLTRVIDCLNGVIDDLENTCPLILKYKSEPISVSFPTTKQPDFYTIQIAGRLKNVKADLEKLEKEGQKTDG